MIQAHPVTAVEINQLHDQLRRNPNGLTRKNLARCFGGDRRARLIIAAAVEQGELAIIRTDGVDGSNVYRLARTVDEVNREADNLARYERSLSRRRRGLLEAWSAGGTARRQPSLYERVEAQT